MTDPVGVRAIQTALRQSIADDAERVGPFLVTIDAHATGPFRNYGIPDDEAAPTADDVAALLAYFVAHDRLPRLEFVAQQPAVEDALAGAGFVVHNRLPLLTLPSAAALHEPRVPDGFTLDRPDEDDRLRAVATMQNAAFDEPGSSDADVVRLHKLAATGAVTACWDADGAAVSGGALAPAQGGLAEICGIATGVGHRRRGLGAAVVGTLSRIALERGLTPYLQSEGDDRRRMYEGIGYQQVGELIDSRGPLTTDHRVPLVEAGEAETALTFLDYLRGCLAAKLIGLSEDDARRPLVPSGTNLLWLGKHVAGVEAFWLHVVFAGAPEDVIPDDEDLSGDTVGSVLALLRRIGEGTADILAAHPDLGELGALAPFGPPLRSLRWTLAHLVEEIGRHAGHADILRELLDGEVGR